MLYFLKVASLKVASFPALNALPSTGVADASRVLRLFLSALSLSALLLFACASLLAPYDWLAFASNLIFTPQDFSLCLLLELNTFPA